jgi:hypothetical protein
MTLILAAVAIVATLTAIALGTMVLRLKRAEQAREAASVELLMKLAAEGQPLDDELVAAGGLFAPRDTESPWLNRLGAAAACAALIVAIGLLFTFGSGRDLMKPETVVAASTPLELVVLEHTQEGHELVIHGVVQNPQPSRTLRGVVANVVLIAAGDADAGTMTTVVDGATLEPGQTAPFTVRVPLDRGVARYRVSFRTPDGRVIAHVDRRAPRSIARTHDTEARR